MLLLGLGCLCYITALQLAILRQDLGTAMGVKRGCLMMMVREHEDYKELYDEVEAEIKALPPPILS